MRNESNNDYTISAVIKALKTLKLFNAQKNELTLTELSALSGIGKSSMLRILTSLEAEGFIRYNEDTKKYCLGIAIFNLANTAYGFLDIRKIAAPILKKAAVEIQLLIHLAVIEDNKIVVIDKVWPTEHLDMVALVSYIGGSVPIHCTGVGKVLTAYASERKRRKMLDECRFEKYTENTITDRDTFEKLLEQVRVDGYAVNDCEHEPYLRCITRPIYNGDGKVIAAVSLSGLKDVITDDKIEYYNIMSRQLTAQLSKEFGW